MGLDMNVDIDSTVLDREDQVPARTRGEGIFEYARDVVRARIQGLKDFALRGVEKVESLNSRAWLTYCSSQGIRVLENAQEWWRFCMGVIMQGMVCAFLGYVTLVYAALMYMEGIGDTI
jgi:hypothetical protein